jgi:prolyl 4-hydroxylase
MWNNMDRNGQPNMKTLPAAMPVLRGIKHVVTVWFRQDPWRLLNR